MKSNILKTFFIKNIKPFLENEDWVLRNHILYLKDNSELLRGICFNSSAFSSDQFEMVAFIQPLYIPCNYIFLTFGKTIKTSKNQQWWIYNDIGREQQGKEIAFLLNKIEKEFLSTIQDASSFYSHYKKHKNVSLAHFESVAYSACFANMSNSINEIVDLKKYISKKEDIEKPYVNEIVNRTNKIEGILRANESPQELLNNWVLDTKKMLKI